MSILNLKNSVGKAVENENWYAALALALTLPDICGKLENVSAGSEKRYVAWFDKYMAKDYIRVDYHRGERTIFMTGSDFYAIRCAFLHEGNDDITTQRARKVLDRFIFAATSSHKCLFDNALMLNMSEFCKEICEAVDAWYEDVKYSSDIQNRINNMMTIKLDTFDYGIYRIH